MTEPTKEQIEAVQAKFSGRDLIQIEVEHDGETYYAVATTPSRVEWAKFLADSNDADLAGKLKAQENLVLLSTKWPERDEMQSLFAKKPAMVSDYFAELGKAVGSDAKARSKKL